MSKPLAWRGAVAATFFSGFEFWRARGPVTALMLWAAAACAQQQTQRPASAVPPSALQVRGNYAVQLVAAEPMLANPVAMVFDEQGRLFVAEQPPYNTPTPQPGRIRVLSNMDEQGAFKDSAVFAEDLPGISGLACYDGGLYVTAGRDVLYLKGTNEPGKTAQRRVVFGGFSNAAGLGGDALLHGITWGVDNRLHVGASGLGIASGVAAQGAPPSLYGGTDYSFDPRAPVLVPESGPSMSGITFDAFGRKFTSDPDRPLRLSMFREPSMNRNPFAPRPPSYVDVIRPDSPIFKIVRSNPAAGGVSNGVVQAFFTSPRAPLIYRSPFAGTGSVSYALIADPAAGVVHRSELRDTDLVTTASRSSEDARAEFISSSDSDFRPWALASGPDGAIYLADRRTAPGQGRIYRLLPVGATPLTNQNFATASSYQLLAALSSENAWHRQTAARMIYERRDAAASSLLTNVVANSRSASARIAALWALAGLGAAPEAFVFRAARDTNPFVREHALILLEQAGDKGVSDEFLRYLGALARDGSPRVRYQLALTLGMFPRPGRAQTLAEILLRDPNNPWITAAVLNAVDRDAAQLLSVLLLNLQARSSPEMLNTQMRIAEMIGLSGQEELVRQLVQVITRSGLEPARIYAIAGSLGDGLDRARKVLSQLVPPEFLEVSYAQALEVAVNGAADANLRAQAVRFLGFSADSYSAFGDWLVLLADAGQPQPVLTAAINSLARYSNPMATSILLQRYPSFPLYAKRETLAALLSRSDRVTAVLDALQSRSLPVADLSTPQADYLRAHSEPAISSRAVTLLGPVTVERPAVLQRFAAATNLSGSISSGRNIFLQRCASCHRNGPDGAPGNLDILSARGRARAQLISDIVQPSKEIAPESATWVVDTKHGRSFTGLMHHDSAAATVLQQCNGTQVAIPRENVLYHRPTAWSLMPSNLADDFNLQTMADLVAYLTAAPVNQSPAAGQRTGSRR